MEESSSTTGNSSADFTVSQQSSQHVSLSTSTPQALNNSNQAVNIATAVVANDRSKSYCKDCDIQFSSIKTYEHHRNNYCQKYKTIEAVVPVEVTSSSNSSASLASSTNAGDLNKSVNSNR